MRRSSEVAGAAAGDEAQEEGQEDGPDDGDEDGVEEAAGAGVAQVDHDEATDDGAYDAYDDVDDRAETGSTHDAAGEVTGDEADENPDDQAVGAFGGLDVAVDVDGVVWGDHVRLLGLRGQMVRLSVKGEGCVQMENCRGGVGGPSRRGWGVGASPRVLFWLKSSRDEG